MIAAQPRILLVEDDLALAAAYQERMEAEGYYVLHCPVADEALQSAINYHPDLILLDILMPKVSGHDLLDILRSAKPTAHTKIIILTAISPPAAGQLAKSPAAAEFLLKSQAVVADAIKRIRFHLSTTPRRIISN